MTGLHRNTVLAAIAAVALISSACGSTSSSSPTAESSAASPATSESASLTPATPVPAVEAKLTVGNYEQDTIRKVLAELEADFTKTYPNVTFQDDSVNADVGNYATQMKLRMAGPSAPDIAQIGQAQALMGPLVKAGLLLDLQSYADTYGWADRFGPGTLDQLKMQPDGKTIGSGGLYGMSLGGNLVGVYYNREKFAALGFTAPPKSLAEFDQMMAKALAAGEVALEAGNLDQWPGLHYWYAITSVFCPAQQIRDWIYGTSGASFVTDCTRAAAEHLALWAKKGYLNASVNGTGYGDAMAAFIKGTGVFNLTGSWMQAQFDAEAPGKIGFFLLPPVNEGDLPQAAGALTPPYGISAKSKNADVAAAFIDSLLTPAALDKLAAVGVLPALKGYQLATPAGSTLADLYASWQSVLDANGLTLYQDWAAPTVLDAQSGEVQLIMGNKSTDPSKLITATQDEWDSFH